MNKNIWHYPTIKVFLQSLKSQLSNPIMCPTLQSILCIYSKYMHLTDSVDKMFI